MSLVTGLFTWARAAMHPSTAKAFYLLSRGDWAMDIMFRFSTRGTSSISVPFSRLPSFSHDQLFEWEQRVRDLWTAESHAWLAKALMTTGELVLAELESHKRVSLSAGSRLGLSSYQICAERQRCRSPTKLLGLWYRVQEDGVCPVFVIKSGTDQTVFRLPLDYYLGSPWYSPS